MAVEVKAKLNDDLGSAEEPAKCPKSTLRLHLLLNKYATRSSYTSLALSSP